MDTAASKFTIKEEILTSFWRQHSAPAEDTTKILTANSVIPHGDLSRTNFDPKLVETRNNLAIVKTSGAEFLIRCMSRSSNREAMVEFQEHIANRLSSIGMAANMHGE